jgi:hypothetical protein
VTVTLAVSGKGTQFEQAQTLYLLRLLTLAEDGVLLSKDNGLGTKRGMAAE